MLGINIIHNGIILPPANGTCSPLGGICSADGEYIEDSCPNLGAGGAYSPEDVDESGQDVIYAGWLNQVWGHTITDVLKKLWYLRTDECKSLVGQGVKIVYITHFDGQPKHVADLLKLLGIDFGSLVRIDRPTRFRTIYNPEDCFVSYGDTPHFTPEYTELISAITQNVKADFPIYEKIYFTRTKATPKFSWKTLWVPKDLREDRIERVFENEGYRVIAPEQYSVAQQIFMLSHCEAFAATEGSISHNAVFCRKGTDVAIIKKEKTPNVYTRLTNEASGVRATVIEANASYNVTSTFYGPFFMCVNGKLERYVGHRIPHLPYWMDPLWYWYMIHNTIIGRAVQKILR